MTRPSGILVIVPDWIRWMVCHYRVYKDADRCIRCSMAPLLDLRDSMGFVLRDVLDGDVGKTVSDSGCYAAVIVGIDCGGLEVPCVMVPAERPPFRDYFVTPEVDIGAVRSAVTKLRGRGQPL